MMSEFNPNDRFEDRLLAELKQHVAVQPNPVFTAEAQRASVLTRPRYRVAIAGATVIAIAGVAIAVGHDPASSAYAVDSQSDGDVGVSISSLEDAAGLQAQLRAQGISAVVNYTPAGKTCESPRFASDPTQASKVFATSHVISKADAAKQSLNTDRGPVPLGGKEGKVVDGVHGAASGPRFTTGSAAGGPEGQFLGKPGESPDASKPSGPLLVNQEDGVVKFTIPAGTVPDGKSIAIEGNTGTGASSISLQIGDGAVAPCKLVDLSPAGQELPPPPKN
jgi:hypothetical protein